MSRSNRMLDAAAEAARRLTESVPSEQSLARQVDEALLGAAGRQRARRRHTGIAAAAVVLMSGVGAAYLLGADGRATPATVMEDRSWRMELPGGDRVTVTPRTELAVLEASESTRRLALRQGTALFDVAGLAEDELFEVVTDAGGVRVRGTVFSVTADDDLRVEVFEGSVEVETSLGRRTLSAGERYASGTHGSGWTSPLAEEGRRAAARRLRREGGGSSGTLAEAGLGGAARQAALEPDPAAASESSVVADGPAAPSGRRFGGPTPPASSRPIVPLLEAQRLLAALRFAEALRAAESALEREVEPGPWRMVRADALRGLGRFEAAADEYDAAVLVLPPSAATQAGFAAAILRQRRLSDPQGALASLERSRAAEPGSPVEERALVLAVELRHGLGRTREAAPHARRYLLRFPGGASRELMEAIASGRAERAPASD